MKVKILEIMQGIPLEKENITLFLIMVFGAEYIKVMQR